MSEHDSDNPAPSDDELIVNALRYTAGSSLTHPECSERATALATAIDSGLIEVRAADLSATPLSAEPEEVKFYAPAPDVAVHWQGGTIYLRYQGCRNCGNAFWTEGDEARRLPAGERVPCPHCGVASEVPA